MCGVPMSVMDVVHMITVRHRHMAAARAVLVIVIGVRDMLRRFAFVEMLVVRAMNMPVVHIVDVLVVRYGYVPATGSVYMIMTGVSGMLSCHEASFPRLVRAC